MTPLTVNAAAANMCPYHAVGAAGARAGVVAPATHMYYPLATTTTTATTAAAAGTTNSTRTMYCGNKL